MATGKEDNGTAPAVEPAETKDKKEIRLKQFLVRGSKDVRDESAKQKAFFILATCAKNARKEFEDRFGLQVLVCNEIAESGFTKDDASRYDFWKENLNWELEIPEKKMSDGARRYFETKGRAERVLEAKRKFGVGDWDSATDEQYASVRAWLARKS